MIRVTEKPVEVLLVEDNPAEVRLITLLFQQTKLNCKIANAKDGEEATDYLFNKVKNKEALSPELIILDLNLPGKDGRKVLEEIKEEPSTRRIPVLILTTSQAAEDISRCYELHANCYITKPSDMMRYNAVMRSIEEFWFSTAELPLPQIARGGW
ncbi:MAG: response regulator [Deltaproteobacteria bacterium]|nr:response regulator [Deltaproteobacteria bacterium]